jgi:hypothetical protein
MPLAFLSAKVFRDLFTPLPETQAATTRKKDHLDHIADYADSAPGAWDVFRVIDHIFSYIKMVPSLSPSWLEVVGKVKNIASSVGIGLSVPKIITDCNTLRRSLSHALAVQDLPYSDPLRIRKIAQACKKSFIDTVDLTFTFSQAALFVASAKIFIFEARHLRIIDGVGNVTSTISDGAELITEYFKLQHYHSSEAQQLAKLEERKRLSWMIIVKDVASIGGAAIALVGIVFGFAIQSTVWISAAVLVLSTVWLTMKLATYFYNKIIVEAPVVQPNRLMTMS